MSHAADRRTAKPPSSAPHVAMLRGPDPSGLYSAGVLSQPLSLVAGSQKAPTREGALEALKARLAELGRPTDLSVFEGVEAAREEVARRSAAKDLLHAISPPFPKRAEALLPDRPDLTGALGELAVLLGAVASGRRAVERAPIEDAKIRCPSEACDAPGADAANPGYGLRATADALLTVDLTDGGEIEDVSNPEVQIDPRGFRDVVCRWCGAELPDLPAEDFYLLRRAARAPDGHEAGDEAGDGAGVPAP